MDALIGIDMGATTIAGGVVTTAGEVLEVVERPTRRDGPGTATATLMEVVERVMAAAGRHRAAVEGIGIGVPGLIDPAKGMLMSDCNLVPELAFLPLADLVRERTRQPTYVDNDVNALALAEWSFGHGRGIDSFVLLAIGTGLGGANILDGRLLRGRHGYAGEWGHVPVVLGGRACRCGGQGCVGAYVSGLGISHEAGLRVAGRSDSALLARAGGDPQAITAPMVFAAARGGDAVAGALVTEACEALAACLGAIVNALNPDLILVTGGVAASLEPLAVDILQRARRYALAPALDDTRVQFAIADKGSTVRGGAALVLYETARRRAAATSGPGV